jgi:hypothetical protein
MTAVVWGSPVQGGNNILVGAALDGSIVMWAAKDHIRDQQQRYEMHKRDTWTGGIDISADGRTVVTRGGMTP